MIPGKTTNVVDLSGRPRETREQVLERLFNEHRDALCAFLWVRLGVDQEVDDIVQDVFARLADLDDLPERLPPGNHSNRAFIFTIANNHVLNLEKHRQVRRRYVEQQTSAHNAGSDGLVEVSPEVVALAEQELERVKQVILKLRPNWRDAFILNRFKHWSYRDIAVVMGVSVKQVEKYMKHALVHVRRAALENSGAGE